MESGYRCTIPRYPFGYGTQPYTQTHRLCFWWNVERMCGGRLHVCRCVNQRNKKTYPCSWVCGMNVNTTNVIIQLKKIWYLWNDDERKDLRIGTRCWAAMAFFGFAYRRQEEHGPPVLWIRVPTTRRARTSCIPINALIAIIWLMGCDREKIEKFICCNSPAHMSRYLLLLFRFLRQTASSSTEISQISRKHPLNLVLESTRLFVANFWLD